MYVLKSKGTDKIPDFVQVRDDKFVLQYHFKTSLLKDNIKQIWPDLQHDTILSTIENLAFGEIKKIN